MKLHTITLGCQMSAADGEEMSRVLGRRGFSHSAAPEDADAVLINTCTVRQHAEDRAVSLIGRFRSWKQERPDRVLIVAGCAAERLKDWIQKRFPHVDLVVGAKSIEQFPEIVGQALSGRFDALAEDAMAFGPTRTLKSPAPSGVSAYVTIMRGCNYSCSYCIVPAVRGRERYRPLPDVLSETELRVASGAREIVLLGQTVNSYSALDGERPVRFPALLRRVDRVGGLRRLRFMSPHPYYLNDDMISAMAESPSVCEHLHLPVQSGSDRILKLMRRNYTRTSYLERISRLRKRLDGVVLSTDIIVGFPSETEDDFRQTLALIEELRPASAYCFKYSPRESTESASWADDVPREIKEERLARLNTLVDRLATEALRGQVGRRAEILCEQPGYGRTRDNFKVQWDDKNAPAVGELAEVLITGNTPRLLLGEKQ